MRRWIFIFAACAACAACDDNTDLTPAPHDAGTEASVEGGAKDAAAPSDAGDAGH